MRANVIDEDLMIAGSLALAFAAALAGAGLYVNWVEQPVPSRARRFGAAQRMGAERPARGGAYRRAFADFGRARPFRLFRFRRRALGDRRAGRDFTWPYAFFVMAPLNNQILTLAPREVGAARALVRQWGLLEYGQTGIGLVATLVFLWAL